ncbi:MAG: hypothetical protein DESF_00759 [Desulfovibrio sp.]
MPANVTGKIAILSDIHGNFLALEAVVRELEKIKPQVTFFLGDAVGYFPDGKEVLNMLYHMGCVSIKGNHEEMILGKIPANKDAVYRLEAQKEKLSARHLATMANWPEKLEITVSANRKLLLVHGSPADPLHGYIYPDTKICERFLSDYSFTFMGHTHHPHIFPAEKTVAINVGSVGLPRDGSTSASYCVLDLETDKYEIHKVKLNVAAMLKKYRKLVHSSVLAKLGGM